MHNNDQTCMYEPLAQISSPTESQQPNPSSMANIYRQMMKQKVNQIQTEQNEETNYHYTTIEANNANKQKSKHRNKSILLLYYLCNS